MTRIFAATGRLSVRPVVLIRLAAGAEAVTTETAAPAGGRTAAA